MSVTLIATATSGSNFASFDFTSISSSYTDLMIIYYGQSAASGAGYERINLALNGESLSSQTNIYWGRGYDDGAAAPTADRISVINVGWLPFGFSTDYSMGYIYIPNYAGTQGVRTLWSRNGNGRVGVGQGTHAFGWSGGYKVSFSTAISRVTLGTESGANLKANSYASLYGITKGGSGTVTPS